MANAWIHAKSSAKKHGGKMEDYLDIHEFMDSSKLVCPANQHRVFTHNNWFVCNVLPRVFGDVRTNSDNRTYSVRQIGIDHCLEDFRMKFVPTAQDYIDHMENAPWMNNAMGDDVPNSVKNMLREKDVVGNGSEAAEIMVGKD